MSPLSSDYLSNVSPLSHDYLGINTLPWLLGHHHSPIINLASPLYHD